VTRHVERLPDLKEVTAVGSKHGGREHRCTRAQPERRRLSALRALTEELDPIPAADVAVAQEA
jgi:hypothetical protein